jgi:hypothetical protein
MPPVPAQQRSPHGGGELDHTKIRIVGRLGIDPVILIREAAAIAGCHPDTLKNAARRGKLTLIKISERRIGVRQSEFNRYLDSRVWAAA